MSVKEKITSCTTEVYSRVCGFFRPVSNWNPGKKEEHKDKKYYKGVKDEQGSSKGNDEA